MKLSKLLVEASHMGEKPWAVIDMIDGEQADAYGPFQSKKAAEEYGWWLTENVGSEMWVVTQLQKPDYNG